MAEDAPKRLTAEEAKAKVAECGEMAARAKFPEHRLMLEHMAGTWERIARTLKAEHCLSPQLAQSGPSVQQSERRY